MSIFNFLVVLVLSFLGAGGGEAFLLSMLFTISHAVRFSSNSNPFSVLKFSSFFTW